MQNIIVSGMLRDFAEKHDLEGEREDLQFEKFVNYSLWKIDHYDTFDFGKVSTGTCVGVDGLGISIGGILVNDVDEARALTRTQFDVRFLFSQSKTSVSLDLGDILKFFNTVRFFFTGDEAQQPPELRAAYRVKQVLYSERAAKMRRLPVVELAYVYTGRSQGERDDTIPKFIRKQVEELQEVPYLTSEVKWYLHDGEALARLYREALNETRKKIAFQRHVALPPIQGAQSTYIGVVRCKDYMDLIRRENGEINKGLFFENVRDYLGADNPVNSEIAKTIRSEDERDRFAILNNGVTVVARAVTPSGDTFQIERFQIVNGCQTSHVLFENRSAITEDMFITLKLIQTSDLDLTSNIIKTTNSQSTVTKEAFTTIRPYHRTVEDFFTAMRAEGYPYYYERRPHQYDDRDDLRDEWVVSAPLLIKSFVSVVLGEPHKVHYYYGRLLEEYNANKESELFVDTDYPGLYFAAHHLLAETRKRIGKDPILSGWWYHVALLIRYQIAPDLRKNGGLNDKRFLALLDAVKDEFEPALKEAKRIVLSIVSEHDQNRIPHFTQRLISEMQRSAGRNVSPLRQQANPRARSLHPGEYQGRVSEVDSRTSRLLIRYGPYEIETQGSSVASRNLRKEDRVYFRVHPQGRVELFEPKWGVKS